MQTQLGHLCTAVASTCAAIMGVGSSSDVVRLHNQTVINRLLDAIGASGVRTVPLPVEGAGSSPMPRRRPNKARRASDAAAAVLTAALIATETDANAEVEEAAAQYVFEWKNVGSVKKLRLVSEQQRLQSQDLLDRLIATRKQDDKM